MLSEYTLIGADLEVLRHCVLVADELADLETLYEESRPADPGPDGPPVPESR